MGILRKLKGGLSTLLAPLLAPAEDPRERYATAQDQQRLLLARVQRALATASLAAEQFEQQAARLRSGLPHLEAQAKHALRAGREDLARLFLQRRQIVLAEAEALAGQLAENDQQRQRLAALQQRLEAQLAALSVREEVQAVRTSAHDQRLEAHVLEALASLTPLEPPAADRFSSSPTDLELAQAVDEQLVALKREVLG